MAVNKSKPDLKTFGSTWTYEVGEGEDKARAVIAYEDDFTGFASRLPTLKSPHPDIPALLLQKIRCTRADGNKITVTLDFGLADWETDVPGKPSQTNATERYWTEPALVDEPILSFHKVQDFDPAIIQALATYQNSDRSDEAYNTAAGTAGMTGDPLLVLNQIRKGQDAVRIPRVVWVRKRIVKNLTTLPWDKVGKIDTPPGDPETPDGYTWMYLVPVVQQAADGLSYDVEERWERSDEGGWEPFFYDTTPP